MGRVKFASTTGRVTTELGTHETWVTPDRFGQLTIAVNVTLNMGQTSANPTAKDTMDVLAAIHVVLGQTLVLGLTERDTILLVLTLFVSTMTLATGRTTVLQGMVHLLLFVVFLFLSVLP